ncbi:MAG: hypothetical protein ACR5KV_00205 [Wolbachia sp.]
MMHTLNLLNVTHFINDANPDNVGFKYYNIKAQNPERTGIIELILDNNRHIRNAHNSREDEEIADKTFDCRFNYIDENTGTTKGSLKFLA